ncbi:hypothetical protein ENTCAN_07564 [Enterobacter cancerogenus ATCC 35316]|nr:hypothetical protein ENTCAN_07564 [Enterobacter cancerogenus ATCC 35316]
MSHPLCPAQQTALSSRCDGAHKAWHTVMDIALSGGGFEH